MKSRRGGRRRERSSRGAAEEQSVQRDASPETETSQGPDEQILDPGLREEEEEEEEGREGGRGGAPSRLVVICFSVRKKGGTVGENRNV